MYKYIVVNVLNIGLKTHCPNCVLKFLRRILHSFEWNHWFVLWVERLLLFELYTSTMVLNVFFPVFFNAGGQLGPLPLVNSCPAYFRLLASFSVALAWPE